MVSDTTSIVTVRFAIIRDVNRHRPTRRLYVHALCLKRCYNKLLHTESEVNDG